MARTFEGDVRADAASDISHRIAQRTFSDIDDMRRSKPLRRGETFAIRWCSGNDRLNTFSDEQLHAEQANRSWSRHQCSFAETNLCDLGDCLYHGRKRLAEGPRLERHPIWKSIQLVGPDD